uniref:FAR1 domain-containing protein n=1 Tax=Ditylenchus dipsaci TaxID=166011 RepID=A0A915D378_9BILA
MQPAKWSPTINSVKRLDHICLHYNVFPQSTSFLDDIQKNYACRYADRRKCLFELRADRREDNFYEIKTKRAHTCNATLFRHGFSLKSFKAPNTVKSRANSTHSCKKQKQPQLGRPVQQWDFVKEYASLQEFEKVRRNLGLIRQQTEKSRTGSVMRKRFRCKTISRKIHTNCPFAMYAEWLGNSTIKIYMLRNALHNHELDDKKVTHCE